VWSLFCGENRKKLYLTFFWRICNKKVITFDDRHSLKSTKAYFVCESFLMFFFFKKRVITCRTKGVTINRMSEKRNWMPEKRFCMPKKKICMPTLKKKHNPKKKLHAEK
jgi:hypothetical protein